MSSVRDTSLLAYQELEPVLGIRQQTVYAMLQAGCSMTNMELARALGWSINRVTPRIFELRRLGFVIVKEKRLCHVTGRMAYSWRVR